MCDCTEDQQQPSCTNPRCRNFSQRRADELQEELYNIYVLPLEMAEWKALKPSFTNKLNVYNYYTITFNLRGFSVTDKFLQKAYTKLQKYTKAVFMTANYEESDSDDPHPHSHIYLITKQKAEHIKVTHINNNFLNKYNTSHDDPSYMKCACTYKKQLFGIDKLKVYQYCRKSRHAKFANFQYGTNPELLQNRGLITFN